MDEGAGLRLKRVESEARKCLNSGQHFVRDFLCFEYFLNLHMLVDEWNQELHFALIIGILLSEFNN